MLAKDARDLLDSTSHQRVGNMRQLNTYTDLALYYLPVQNPSVFGHIARKDSDNLEKLIVTGRVDGKRLRGKSQCHDPQHQGEQEDIYTMYTSITSIYYDYLLL